MSKKIERYSDDFKLKIVQLYNGGKSVTDLVNEYEPARSTIEKWISHYNNSGSFKTKDNRTEEEKELIELRKENKKLKMENDILKQAALILAKK